MINGNRTKSKRTRHPRDFYITPISLARAALMRLRVDGTFSNNVPISALDAGCGTGVWGIALNRLFLYVEGIDLYPNVTDKYYDKVVAMDYLKYVPEQKFDFIFGNPPYSIAEEFIRHSFEILQPHGHIYFLLRLSFLEGIKRCRGLYKEFPLKRLYVCSRRPSFYSSDGEHHTTDTLSYGMFLWEKGYYVDKPTIDFLDWNYEDGNI